MHLDDVEDTVPYQPKINSCKYANNCKQYYIIEKEMRGSVLNVFDSFIQ